MDSAQAFDVLPNEWGKVVHIAAALLKLGCHGSVKPRVASQVLNRYLYYGPMLQSLSIRAVFPARMVDD